MTRKAKDDNWEQPVLHQALLIRCWQQGGERRLILQGVRTRKRPVFRDVAALVVGLTAVLDSPATENK